MCLMGSALENLFDRSSVLHCFDFEKDQKHGAISTKFDAVKLDKISPSQSKAVTLTLTLPPLVFAYC